MTDVALSPPWTRLPAAQQPGWADHPSLPGVRDRLAEARPLVGLDTALRLADELAAVAAGEALVLQAGDCAESFDELSPAHTEAKLDVLDAVADRMAELAGRPVVRIGRLGGQFAKPRSAPTEVVDGRVLPAFRGHAVNSAGPDPAERRPDPRRLLCAYTASDLVLSRLTRRPHPLWASHEALLLDYEAPLVRFENGRRYLSSAHLPWLGYRTSQPDHAHVALLAGMANPVAVKIGPSTTPEQAVRLCAVLDPDRRPGRLTLIARLGRAQVRTRLAPVVTAVLAAGHPAVWLCDPSHGNTFSLDNGVKTRRLADMVAEARTFHDLLTECGARPGGLHLELAADDVTECVGGGIEEADLRLRYRSLCDPRLNPGQALLLLDRLFHER
ncbi:3-deoxy-7-phosphoheptulonate synthase [Streptomyces roseirectus]|uniref:Phospho-2-dehydro-3-deoxyheptonate aldolase n=1 Tax=Streptomyces roseirectus TaxID=2768066 RepID=A0A7H0IPX4_9ACTN|nr:3-deoxy-7-phosphoheptulonate synthase [Streptomyces roseirectus]QNP74840.1 3-deoxy-7-phosphoheptulonate synthase [Streptomyces roseirectus]